MGRKPSNRKRIDDYTQRAMAAEEAVATISPGVYLPPAIRGKGLNVAYNASDAKVVDIKSNMVKIALEADPIGQLTALANGQPVAFFDVDTEGKLTVSYGTPSLTQRISILKWLGDRVIPRISITKKFTDPDGDKTQDDWSATISMAATRDKDEEDDSS